MAAPSTRLRLRVSPGAGRDEFVGRYGEGWKVRVDAPPERGRANDAVLRLVAKRLGIARTAVTLVSGASARDKVVELHGMTAELQSVWSPWMPELDLGAFRSRLTEERARVVAAIDYLEYENAGSMEDEGEEAGIGNHLAETASATLDREIDYSSKRTPHTCSRRSTPRSHASRRARSADASRAATRSTGTGSRHSRMRPSASTASASRSEDDRGDGPERRGGGAPRRARRVSVVERRLSADGIQWLSLGLVAAAAILADQITKHLVASQLAVGDAVDVVGPFSIHHVHNSGVAFGLFDRRDGHVIALTSAAVLWMLVFFARSGARHPCCRLRSGSDRGQVSNLLDRVRLGHVTDFLDLRFWPAFNLAGPHRRRGRAARRDDALGRRQPETSPGRPTLRS